MRTTLLALALIGGALSGNAFAAAKDQEIKVNLERQLASPFALSQLTGDKMGVAFPGTLFSLRINGFMGSTTKSLLAYQNIYKNGKLAKSFGNSLLQDKATSITFQPGDAFYLTRVEAKDEGIVYHFVSANEFGGSLYISKLTIPFPKGSISSVDPRQIEQGLGEVFSFSAQPQAAAPGPAMPPSPPQPTPQFSQAPPPEPAPQPLPQPAPAPATIALGQSFDQVTAAVGQPDKIVKLGEKEIYFYKDMKVTFLNGKVSDVQ